MPQPVETVPVEEVPVESAAIDAIEEVAVTPAEPVAPTEEVPQELLNADVPEIEIVDETAAELAAAPAASAASEEVDLSAEWASLLEETKEPESAPAVEAPAAPPVPLSREGDEVQVPEFVAEEPKAEELPEEAVPVEPLVPAFEETGHGEFHVPVEAMDPEDWTNLAPDVAAEPPPVQAEAHAEEPAPVEEEIGQLAETLLPDEEPTALPVPEHAEVAAEGHEPALEQPQAALPEAMPPQPEFELDQEFELLLEPEEVVPAHELLSKVPPAETPEPIKDSVPAEAERVSEDKVAEAVPSNMFSSDKFLSDLAKEIDELGLDELTPTMSQPHDAAHDLAKDSPKDVLPITESGPLKEVFDEFRAELGEMGSEDEDLETHYNLGIAFREMGLLEEAIGEFQKVAKANDRGKAFRYAMQCSTLLGLAFMEKGQPDIAAIWYERALTTPGLDSESKLALRYDLGVAQESAGDLEAALKSFSQVYAVNIDYRDVAERIASLQKPAR
jgi:tetratricopeptide (TPR) repeat protein